MLLHDGFLPILDHLILDKSQTQSPIEAITKRTGDVVTFDKSKITGALEKAFAAVGQHDPAEAERLTGLVIDKLHMSETHSPTVEDIQDMVESTLIENGQSEATKAFIVYRHERRQIRDEKMRVLNSKTLDPVARKFDVNSLRVLASRYLIRNNRSEIVEPPADMFRRVAVLVGLADVLYDPVVFDRNGNHVHDVDEALGYLAKLDNFDKKFKIGNDFINKWHFRALINHYVTLARTGSMKMGFKDILTMLASKKFDSHASKIDEYYDLMTSQDFLPNSPTMMNAGCRLGQLSACFVLDMPDDMASIMQTTSDAALIFQSGGGVGINYTKLRQEGDIVASTSGVASGPVSFMNVINTVTEVVKQGGKRRGANMGIMEVWHPDIEKFITNKTKAGVLENFNVSVGIWDDFWQALVDGGDGKYSLRSVREKKPVRDIDSHHLFDLIAQSAWKSAEPGVIFFDQINKYNVFAKARGEPLSATNPCGEQSLYPYESCNLGSINLANLVKRRADGDYEFDWQRYEEVIRKTTRFLDRIIDVNLYPIAAIDKASKESRRIGLGVMGVADLLYKLRIAYNSQEGYDMQSKLAEALTYYSMEESVAIAKSLGAFPLCAKTEYPDGKIPVAGYYEKPTSQHSYDWDALIEKIKIHGIRNVLTTTVAPTGTLSMISQCSSGMEPTFALVFEKHVTVGTFLYANTILKDVLTENGLYNDNVLDAIKANYGSLSGLDIIPEWMQKVFVTAMDIHWSDHIMAQSVWQQWIGNAIAKTINMPYDVTAEDVKASYLLAHELGLKGVTIYRDGSRHTQVLNMSDENAEKKFTVTPSPVISKYVSDNIANTYIRTEVGHALEMRVSTEHTTEQVPIEPPEESLCPSCKNKLVFVEGCNICIECGFSGCTSG